MIVNEMTVPIKRLIVSIVALHRFIAICFMSQYIPNLHQTFDTCGVRCRDGSFAIYVIERFGYV